ncbi:WD40-repeat-containing domain protein [Sparassis latifolia]|uniref:Transcription factor spt8 beta-propeller domain-containing protein n=1 Tax=Sparassis crispa TaxID=139825 RepID=A0A401GIL1_9APHY|nr:hypothetical protein SCP_0403270 [Sparassis crispa]GBE81951.1 hypothetical protein SCP_0403270 [Sparassis crispa]
MAHSDSEDEINDDAEYDRTTEADDDVEDDILDALEGDLAAAAAAEEASEDDSYSDDSDGGSDDEDAEDEAHPPQKPVPDVREARSSASPVKAATPPRESPKAEPVPLRRSLSPAQARREKLVNEIQWPRSYTVEAICAIPHPVPTHCLASSACMTHLLTGSEDGYIRDYDVFAAVNNKVVLTAPQRHHCGVMEGDMKAGQIKCWWENLADVGSSIAPEEPPLSPVYSLAMHSDALWALAGSKLGHINLFTVRHDPGQLCHVMRGHRGPVSALAMQHDEMGFFSAGWDGEAVQWDLNTGQNVRTFTAHGAQLAAIAVRPLVSDFSGYQWSTPPSRVNQLPSTYSEDPPATYQNAATNGRSMSTGNGSAGYHAPYFINGNGRADQVQNGMPQQRDEDAKSDTSFDPLFDDEPDADGELDQEDGPQQPPAYGSSYPPAAPQIAPQTPQYSTPFSNAQPSQFQANGRTVSGTVAAPKNGPPILDPTSYTAFSPDVLMTASVDGQVILWDTRVQSSGHGVGRLWMSEKTPPWCVSACWSADGAQIYAGRRNGTIDIWDVRQTGRTASGIPKILKTLRNPVSSGVVSCVVAFPDGRHLACASNDNIRLWNVAEAGEPDAWGKMKSGVQFKIIPGHHGGYISQMLLDRAARFLVSASSNRGWHGESTKTVFVHEIKHLR